MTQPASCARLARRPVRDQVRAIAAVALLLVAACTAAPNGAAARSAPDSFSPLVKRVLPAVVNIAVTETVSGNDVAADLPPELRDTPLGREFRRRFGNKHEQMMGAGSGFIIDPSGVIVTNNHVVDHADKIVVSLTDGRQLAAHVLGTDELTDVAVIKIDAPAALASVTWGDSRLVEVGDWILVAGNPYDGIPAGRYFNPAAFAVPAKGTFGDAGTNILYGPGVNNWDLSMTKRFRLGESRVLSLRGEAFNVWNHTQFSSVYSTAQFQPGGAQIDPTFGLPSAARAPRNVQLSARFTF